MGVPRWEIKKKKKIDDFLIKKKLLNFNIDTIVFIIYLGLKCTHILYVSIQYSVL